MRTRAARCLFCLVVSLSTVPLSGADAQLVGYWPLDGNAVDMSGNNLLGTVTDAAFLVDPFGLGLSVNGNLDSMVEVPPNNLLAPSNAVAISLWFNQRSAVGQFACLAYKAARLPGSVPGFGDRSYSLWVLPGGGGLHFTSTGDGQPGQAAIYTGTGLFTLNQWVNAVGVVDTSSHLMSLYLNGNLAGQVPYPGNSIIAGNYPFQVGAPVEPLTGGDQTGFDGIINEVRVYNRALSSNEVVQLFNSRTVVTVQGRVTDNQGGVPGATVTLSVGQTQVEQTTTDALGNYQLAPVGGGVYVLAVSEGTHADSARAIMLAPSTAWQDFQLTSLPPAPGVVQVSRQPMTGFTQSPNGTLMAFQGGAQEGAFVPIPEGGSLPAASMTIVLTHGLNNSSSDWPTAMAKALRAQYGTQQLTPAMANILAWDWHEAAASVIDFPPEERTPSQGLALGQELQLLLGATYSQKMHFMGHSLGAMVNAAAVNYLRGQRTGQQPVSPTPWKATPIHVTLFDGAEAASGLEALGGGVGVLFDGISASIRNSTDLIEGFNGDLLGWKPSVPFSATWADNYVSLFGYYQPTAVNVFLEGGFALYPPPQVLDLHGFPQEWYTNSIASPTSCILGFQQSFESGLSASGSTPPLFPPTGDAFALGVSYVQSPAAMLADPLTLSLDLLPAINLFAAVGTVEGDVLQGLGTGIQAVGDVAAQVAPAAQSAAESAAEGFNYVENLAAQGERSVVNLYDSAVLQLWLHTTPSPAPGPGVRPMDLTNGTPMAWLTIGIPTNATAMAFDFAVQGNPVDDAMVCGIGQTNLFSMQAKYVPTNTISSSRLIDVSPWVGQQVELFFGFMGGASTNATLEVENIRFYALQPPSLNIQFSNGTAVLTWPSSAVGYAIESTTSLSAPSWETTTNAPALSAGSYALTNGVADQARFFRLRSR